MIHVNVDYQVDHISWIFRKYKQEREATEAPCRLMYEDRAVSDNCVYCLALRHGLRRSITLTTLSPEHCHASKTPTQIFACLLVPNLQFIRDFANAPNPIFRRVHKIAKNSYYRRVSAWLAARPPARMKQLGSHWIDFREILYLSILLNSVDKIQVSLKPDKNNGYFTWRRRYICDISLNYS
jgi:hypothetical protein